jgi:hypothetical protein
VADRKRIEARDAGLERLSALTRWVLGGGLIASGVVASTAAHAFTGHGPAASPAPAASTDAGSPAAGPAPDSLSPSAGGATASPSLAAQPAVGVSGGYAATPSSVPPRPARRWHTVSRGS